MINLQLRDVFDQYLLMAINGVNVISKDVSADPPHFHHPFTGVELSGVALVLG